MLERQIKKSKSYLKPLSFTTTLRNPERIAGFLKCISPFAGQKLTNDLIVKIVKSLIQAKLYSTKYQKSNPEYKRIYDSLSDEYTEDQLNDIIVNSPQRHKEAGFDLGWPSRFDTWYKITKEFGFLFYSINQNIILSETGSMIVSAFNEEPVNYTKIQKIFLNSLMKYPRVNPYRRVLNNNMPLSLLLNVIKLLKKDDSLNGAGVHRKEIPFFLCWPNNDAKELYFFIKSLREKIGCSFYTDEIIYDKCLNLLQTNNQKLFKSSQICKELVDDYIRKMRMTGLISFRGAGNYIDINSFEKKSVDYVCKNYSEVCSFQSEKEFFLYIGKIDENILNLDEIVEEQYIDVKQKCLYEYAKKYSSEQIFDELRILKRKQSSSDPVLKYIPEPTRLEFLVSVSLVQNLKNVNIKPNYKVDDTGIPTFTASGGFADIECFDSDYDSYFEVTLMTGRQNQINNEMIPIQRHLQEAKRQRRIESFSVFVAPVIHQDVKLFAEWVKNRNNDDIIPLDITEFIEKVSLIDTPSQLLLND